ncbi:hypothetical protein V2J09_007757 [Rumex salicifolius]
MLEANHRISAIIARFLATLSADVLKFMDFKEKRFAGSTAVDEDNKGGTEHGHSFTFSQYERLIALLDQQQIGSSTADNNKSSMLAGNALCFSVYGINTIWVIDSGATHHICPSLSMFSTYKPYPKANYITMPNNKQAPITNIGTVHLTPTITLHHVLHVSEFSFNLLSVGCLVQDLQANVLFTPTECLLQGPSMSTHRVLGNLSRGLYLTNTKLQARQPQPSSALSLPSCNDIKTDSVLNYCICG